LISVFYDKLLNQTVASFTDVTERKEIENSLRESREEYRKLVELQGEGLAIVDKEERFIFTNPAAERMMGVPAGTLIGRKMDEFVSKTTFEQIKQQTIIRADGNQSTYEIEIIRENGEKRVILVTATPQFDGNGVFESSLGIFIDITDRKNIENELKKNESTLKALNTTKDKLFSIIAHDLRGPIGTSADLLEVMIENYENFSSDEQLKMLDILKNSAKSTYSLLETLLNWSIVQTGNIVFRPELFNLTKCVDTIVRNVVPTLYSKNITLLYEPAEEIFCYADQNMIQTVIRNLIGNAIKYTFRNGTIEIRVINKGNNTEISISDNGIGMDEETRNNLFVLDKQSSKYGTENEKGTGLGLILCKEFIEKHGGHLLIESEKDKGSSFTFELPQINSKGEAPGLKGNEENRTQKKFNNELILIVEDDEINYQILKSMLTSVNVKCERASTGKEAVSMFLKNNYSLILLDIQLPEMNGWEATMKIRENDTEIPIIAVTAYASDPTRRRSIEAGCNDFITKPIHKAKLLQMLDKYIRKNTISSNIEK
jgi:PAS domain S-box-containing protein